MKTLKHNDKVIINGRKGTIGTVRGYAEQYGEDGDAAIALQVSFGNSIAPWVNQKVACLCSDPGYYERENKEWENAILIEGGEIVIIEGAVYTTQYKGDYSDMVHFV